MSNKLREWIEEEVEEEIINLVWGDFRNKMEILHAEAYEEIRKQAKVAAAKINKKVLEEIKLQPATAEKGKVVQ